MFNPANIQMGMTARDRDGERLGTIIAVDAGGFFIGRSGFFTRDYRVAFADVTDLDGDDVYLREAVSDLPGVNPEVLSGARRGVAAPDQALQHDLTGGLGVAPKDPDAARMDSARPQEPGPLAGGLGLQPRDLETARMDSARFQDHGRYNVGPGASAHVEREHRRDDLSSEADPAVVAVRQPPVVVERRAALDEDEPPRREAPSGVDPDTRR